MLYIFENGTKRSFFVGENFLCRANIFWMIASTRRDS